MRKSEEEQHKYANGRQDTDEKDSNAESNTDLLTK